jgi:hypothetical protein
MIFDQAGQAELRKCSRADARLGFAPGEAMGHRTDGVNQMLKKAGLPNAEAAEEVSL